MKIQNKFKIILFIMLIFGMFFLIPKSVYADDGAIVMYDLNGGTGTVPDNEYVSWGIYYNLP